MKKLLLLVAVIFINQNSFSQQKTVSLNIAKFNSFDEKYRTSADSAIKIANILLNSQEFRDSLIKYKFSCKNYNESTCEGTISGKVALDSLYRKKNVVLTLNLLNEGGSFGDSRKDVYEINSHFITLINDDNVLPFAYIYAYHICHEYMHIVGFYHFQKVKRRVRNLDIAEQTGWTAYYILDKWYKEKKKLIK
jgi:hypothetical protein